MSAPGFHLVSWVATATPSPGATPRYLDDSVVRPGWLGFAVFLAMLVAAYFLFRSMRHQLKKVDFEEEPREEGDGTGPRPS